MNLELTEKQFRRLLDLVYIGNWVLNSTRPDDRISDYDEVETAVFSKCESLDMKKLIERLQGEIVPSQAFCEGGIQEAITDYEYTVFFEILAEELARRDMQEASLDENDEEELNERILVYIAEFERNGTDNIILDM